MLYTGPGAAALIGRRGRNLTVIMQARFAIPADRTEWPFQRQREWYRGYSKSEFLLPSLKGFLPLGGGFFVPKVQNRHFEGGSLL